MSKLVKLLVVIISVCAGGTARAENSGTRLPSLESSNGQFEAYDQNAFYDKLYERIGYKRDLFDTVFSIYFYNLKTWAQANNYPDTVHRVDIALPKAIDEFMHNEQAQGGIYRQWFGDVVAGYDADSFSGPRKAERLVNALGSQDRFLRLITIIYRMESALNRAGAELYFKSETRVMTQQNGKELPGVTADKSPELGPGLYGMYVAAEAIDTLHKGVKRDLGQSVTKQPMQRVFTEDEIKEYVAKSTEILNDFFGKEPELRPYVAENKPMPDIVKQMVQFDMVDVDTGVDMARTGVMNNYSVRTKYLGEKD